MRPNLQIIQQSHKENTSKNSFYYRLKSPAASESQQIYGA